MGQMCGTRHWLRRRSDGATGRPHRLFLLLPVVAVVLICAGCTGQPGLLGNHHATTPGHAQTVTPSHTTAVAVPTLGRPAGVFAHGAGFGQVRPKKIFNGGDPTGIVSDITWSSWGGSRAMGTGTSDYVGPSQSVATGKEEHATVVAFKLGTCHGQLMYQAVEWYFPQHGQKFNPHRYENICAGGYVFGQ
jgi:hypothetical protein